MARYIEEAIENKLAFHQIPSILLEEKGGIGMKSKIGTEGTIRTSQTKCIDCNADYPFHVGYGWACKKHNRSPDRHFIDVYWSKNRYRLFADKHGNILYRYKDAEAVLSAIRGEIAANSFDPTLYVQSELSKYKVSTQLDSFLEEKLSGAEKIAPSYIRNYERFCRTVCDHLGTLDIRDIRKIHVLEFHQYIAKTYSHYSKKSIKNVLDFLRTFLNHAKDHEMITVVPTFPKIFVPKPPITTLAPETIQLLFSNIPERDRPIFAFLLLNGQRVSEARSLKIKDVNLDTGLITVHSTFSQGEYRETRKGRGSRPAIVPIHSYLMPYLKKRVNTDMPEAFVFLNFKNEHYKESSLRKIWYRARDATGIDETVALKDATRHSVITNLLESGMSIYDVSQTVGHSSVGVTEKYYAHTSAQKRRVGIEQLSVVPKEEKVVKLERVSK